MGKLLLIIFVLCSSSFLAQDSVVYKRKAITGRIIDYSPVGALVRNSEGDVKYCINYYTRLVFSDTLIVLKRYPFNFKKRTIVDTVFLKNGSKIPYTKCHLEGAPGIKVRDDELIFSFPVHGNDYFVVKKADIERQTHHREVLSLTNGIKSIVLINDSSKSHRVFLRSGIVFKTDFCYFKRRKLFIEDETVASKLSIPKKEIDKIVYSDTLTSYFDTSNNQKPKIYPPVKDIKYAKFYPYWMKKNYAGVNITNFLMCDFNVSYYRSIIKDNIDIGLGINFPIYSTSQEISNLSVLNNQYYKFTKNYEFVLSAEYYLFHSDFFKNLSVGLVYRHTNFNYTYVDNSQGYYKYDKYEFIEKRSGRIANAGFASMGCFIPVRKWFFFKANIGLGWEQYDDPYQLNDGRNLYGSNFAAYTNFMAGFKF